MAIKDALLPELDQEAAVTRKLLKRVPADKLGWKPHEKSMTLGRLATHIAEMPGWTDVVINQNEFDVEPPGGEPYTPTEVEGVAQLLEMFDAGVTKMRELLDGTSDAEFMEPWTLKKGGEDVFTIPRIGVVRNTLFNHAIHHRGQLSVYLRLAGAPVPGSYGPTADEPM